MKSYSKEARPAFKLFQKQSHLLPEKRFSFMITGSLDCDRMSILCFSAEISKSHDGCKQLSLPPLSSSSVCSTQSGFLFVPQMFQVENHSRNFTCAVPLPGIPLTHVFTRLLLCDHRFSSNVTFHGSFMLTTPKEGAPRLSLLTVS